MKKFWWLCLLIPTLGLAQGVNIGGFPNYASPISGGESIPIYTGGCNGAANTCKTPVSAIKTYLGNYTLTIASGTAALGTSSIASGTCAPVVTVLATGTLTTDVIGWGFTGDPTATVGYQPSASGMLTIIVYPTTNNFNAKVCNNTQAAIVPGPITLNFRVTR